MPYFREEINSMAGYVPGEQPKDPEIIKLNTNENPYPPSPAVEDAFKSFKFDSLRLYPDPFCTEIRNFLAESNGLDPDNIVVGNGSDDVLTMIFRCFTDRNRFAGCLFPTYSLYPSLSQMQGAECRRITLRNDFTLPENFMQRVDGTNLLVITRPNSPPGNSVPKAQMAEICSEFKGIVLIDEAYVDFAGDNCLDFVNKFQNVVISRTLSKSYSLAGLRMVFAFSSKKIIEGMLKVKDSYNVSRFTQTLALASLKDTAYLKKTVGLVKQFRTVLSDALLNFSFKVIPSDANFIFASPPDQNGEAYFMFLRKHNIIVRYFPGDKTGAYVRITIGTEEETRKVIEVTKKYLTIG